MLLQIHREKQPDRLIRMGHAPVVLQPEPEPEPVSEQVQAPPVEQTKSIKGRKKMADKQNLDEVGTKTIRKDDPGTKGAIGSGGQNAPAQEKVPETPQDTEKEGK